MCKPGLFGVMVATRLPVIQGYVQVETCSFTYDDEWPNMEKDREKPLDSINFNITIISRRSRFRAGMSQTAVPLPDFKV